MEIIAPLQIVKLIAALALVIALMGGLSLLLKKLGLAETIGKNQNGKRLKIIETLPLDARRRLTLIQCDHEQHLLILGQNSETVIKTDIAIPPKSDDNSLNDSQA